MNYFKHLVTDGHTEFDVSRFTQEFVVANDQDLTRLADGTIRGEAVRSCEITGWVDTGAHDLVLPEVVGDSLGVPDDGMTIVRFADHSSAKRRRVSHVRVTLCGRSAVFRAVLLPERHEALSGALVLETLDLLVDPMTRTLVPRDPEGEVSIIDTATTVRLN